MEEARSDSKKNKEEFKFSKAYPSPYMREPDLCGKDVTLTIAGWRYADASDKGSDGKPMEGTVVSFKETDKELVLAKVNHISIRRIHGPDPAEWTGKRVTFYPTTCAAFGDPRKPCIRVRSINPETGKEPDLF
jgi:hypothetical protein